MRSAYLVVAVLTATIAMAEEVAPDGARGAAFELAKRSITPTLKNPDSAKFDWETVRVKRAIPVKSKDGSEEKVVIVSGVVRATNSFNAVVPSEWTVMMLHNADGYETMTVSLDKQFVVKTERGEKFLNAMVERKEIARQNEIQVEQRSREKEQQAAAKRAALEAAHNAGRDSGNSVAARFGRNVKTASDALVEKQLQRAKKDSKLSDNEEIEQFQNGFMAAIRDAREGKK